MTLPPEFKAVTIPAEDQLFNYREYRVPGSTARICYEETDWSVPEQDRQALEQLFAEKLPDERTCRKLDFPEISKQSNSLDTAVANALCHCLIFGGRLMRDGSCIAYMHSTWEIRKVGLLENARTMLVGKLRFEGPNGKTIKNRQARLVMPVVPGKAGNGYLWLEGTEQEIRRYENIFFQSVVAGGKFRELAAAGS